jgi:hypothetical protein
MWETAPEDVIVNIFLCLRGRGLPQAAFVCRSWLHAAHSDRLWKVLFYRKWKPLDDRAIKHAPKDTAEKFVFAVLQPSFAIYNGASASFRIKSFNSFHSTVY